MTGKTVALCTWRALGWEGDGICCLARVDPGWSLVGHARFYDDLGYAALDYTVRCDEYRHTINADVAGLHGDLELRVRIEHGNEGWILNGIFQIRVDVADNLDLSFAPTTNLMLLRRLRASGSRKIRLLATCLHYLLAALRPLHQTYATQKGGEKISHVSVQTGFVMPYPKLWQGEVQHAA